MRPISKAITLLLVSSLAVTAASVGVVATGEAAGVGTASEHVDAVTPAETERNSTVARSQAESGELVVETTFSLEDVDSDEIRVVREYHLGSGVDSVEETVDHPIRDVSTSHMSESGGGSETTFRWDGTGDVARVEYVADANDLGRLRSDHSGPKHAARGDGYAVVGATYDGLRTDADTTVGEVAVDGEGTAGETFAVLGPYEEHVEEVEDGQVRLVVPDHAAFEAEPNDVLDGIRATDEQIDAGVSPGANATFIAVNHSLGAPSGIEYDSGFGSEDRASDVVVVDNSSDTFSPIWEHETVHQRKQSYRTADSAKWTTEGNPQYYGRLLRWTQGHTEFDRFRTHFSLVDGHANARLSDPDTWAGEPIPASNYEKGARMTAWLDAEIRNETDGERSYEDVLRRMNDHSGRLTHGEFLDIVGDVGGSDLESAVDRYVTTDAVPPEPPQNPYLYSDDDIDSNLSVERTDPNATPEMHPGGRVMVPVEVTNHGSEASVALGFEFARLDNWTFFAGGSDTDFEPVPGADTGYFQVPAGETETVDLYFVVPDNESVESHDFEVTARDLAGEQAALDGSIEVVEKGADSSDDSEESDESDESESVPPPSAVGMELDSPEQVGTTGENGSVPVYSEGQSLDVTPTFEATNYTVESVEVLVNESRIVNRAKTNVRTRAENDTVATEPNRTFRLSDSDAGSKNVTVRMTLENGGVVERNRTVLFNDEPEVSIHGYKRDQTGVKKFLKAGVTDDYGDLEYRWIVDGEQVGTEDHYEYEYPDGRENVTLVVTDEYGATARESRTFEGSPGPMTVWLVAMEFARSTPTPVLLGGGLAVVAVGLLGWRLR
ncbi:hypothetical protein NGM10_03790 [Halorussus salilacus]|uniref:hypothetical protein n=1 Tax=Halorussus salilacus TaxID=2953750 RepID=UPI00209F1507|nr:hypothetical protein [Halorussus salilacus]USZ68864.1 hypothetical protein NGM10_03790 [Halorussus salilacus]